jgi:hypothetical protein
MLNLGPNFFELFWLNAMLILKAKLIERLIRKPFRMRLIGPARGRSIDFDVTRGPAIRDLDEGNVA